MRYGFKCQLGDFFQVTLGRAQAIAELGLLQAPSQEVLGLAHSVVGFRLS